MGQVISNDWVSWKDPQQIKITATAYRQFAVTVLSAVVNGSWTCDTFIEIVSTLI